MSRDHDRHRPNATDRGYDAKWEKAAKAYKRANPLCVGCLAIGVHTPTRVVDHIVPHKGDPVRLWDPYNWQPCCAWHHDSVKATLELEHALGYITAHELRLDSERAIELTRLRHRPRVGVDGFNIPGT